MKIQMITLFLIVELFISGCNKTGTANEIKKIGISHITKNKTLDFIYRIIDGEEILMDIFLPETNTPVPAIIWIHGGGFTHNSRKNIFFNPDRVTHRGYAFISIDYRLAPEYTFPYPVHDCKAAIQWVKENSGQLNIDPDKIGLWGDSAGGYFVSLLGTSWDVEELEEKGLDSAYDSSVKAVCDFYGSIDPYSFFMGELSNNADAMKLANPVFHISENDPPFLIMHGKKDSFISYTQSVKFYNALKQKGVPAELVLFENAEHGHLSDEFWTDENMDRVFAFFDKNLKNISIVE